MDDLLIARSLFGTTMAFHIIFATIGVGLPFMILVAELLYQKTKDQDYVVMAKRWTKAFAVLLGVGIPTGTIAGVQLSLLWPGFLEVVARVMPLPFQIEIYAFFVEALFMSIYVYAAERIAPWMRIVSLVLVALGALASAVLITNVHAWQGTPAGFNYVDGQYVDIDPWAAFFNPSFFVTATHVALSAYVVGAFVVASVASFKMLRNEYGSRVYRFHQKALTLSLIVGGIFAFLTATNGHESAQYLHKYQPEKLAAAEGLFETQSHAPLAIGGFTDRETQTIKWGIEIPWALSYLAGDSFDTVVVGLNDFPEELWPPLFVHTLFNVMVIIGSLLIFIPIAGLVWRKVLKKDRFPKLFLWLLVTTGPLAISAIESGWILACSGRQPWVIYRILSTADASTTATDLGVLFMLFIGVYIILGFAVVFVLLYFFRKNTELDDLERAANKSKPLFSSNS
ncbi:cytochrome ubiquinol oxidase subunit I [Bacillus sp. AK128]